MDITYPTYGELTEDEKENASGNGHGAEYAGYIRVSHNSKTIALKSDAMEPEDAIFSRDLSWISSLIYEAYELGRGNNG